MKQIASSLAMVLLLLYSPALFSQVTIGTLLPPLKGALLDLKQNDDLTGGTTTTKGLMYPRVALSDLNNLVPMLSTADAAAANKLQYAGLTVYNVNETAPFQKGMYVWDGAKWNHVWAINAGNGLSLSVVNDTVKLGGTLRELTQIMMNGNNLVFRRTGSTGNIGIGNAALSPKAPLEIAPSSGEDPLILDNLQYTSDALNTVDAANPNTQYYNMQISDKGVVRKSPIVNDESKTFIFTLYNTTNTNIAITTGGADGLGGSLLTWRIGGRDSSYVALPEDGAYMFSFRLYGPTTNQNRTNSFYFSSLVNSTTSNVFDVQEIVLTSSVTAGYVPMTYTANLTAAGKKGDKIYFRLAELNVSAHIITWTLNGNGTEKGANRTSMVYWKL